MKRSRVAIANLLDEDKNGVITAKGDIEIHLPSTFPGELVIIEENISVVGSFAFVTNSNYSVMSAMTMFNIAPSTYISDNGFHVFGFKKGDTVIKSSNVIQSGAIVYPILNTYIFKGKIPWYLTYEDISTLLLHTGLDAGLDIDVSPPIIDMMVAMIATELKTGKKLRHVLKEKNQLLYEQIKYVAINNVSNVDNNLNKLLGNRQNSAMLSTLISDATGDATITEKALRA